MQKENQLMSKLRDFIIEANDLIAIESGEMSPNERASQWVRVGEGLIMPRGYGEFSDEVAGAAWEAKYGRNSEKA